MTISFSGGPSQCGIARGLTCILAALLFILAGCLSSKEQNIALNEITIQEVGFDAGGEFCSGFRMTPDDVSAFFERAEIIDPLTLHANFDFLPCYVRGQAYRNNSVLTWEIRPGGTGKLSTQDGPTDLYGCAACDDLYRGWR